jgi:hypothetical protein
MAKAPAYSQGDSKYSVSKEKESYNAPYETYKAVVEAEKSMAIKVARGGTSVKNADGGYRCKRII